MSQIENHIHLFHESLTSFIKRSNEIMNRIYQVFPNLNKKIKEDRHQAQAIIDHFLYNLNDEGEQGIAGKFNQHKDQLLGNSVKIEQILDDDNKLMQHIYQSIDGVKKINHYIQNIKTISKDIKVYSLNSIIISSKSGERGRGYSALSQFFIQFSQDAKTKSDEMLEVSKDFMAMFHNFEENIHKLEKMEQGYLADIRKDISSTFEKLIKSFQSFSTLFNNIFDRVDEARKVIPEIITSLQHQDIVEQQLMHIKEHFSVILSYSQIFKKNHDECSIEDLKILVFIKDLILLNSRQIISVRDGIYHLYQTVSSKLNTMDEILASVEDDKNMIVSYLTSNSYTEPEKKTVLTMLFESTYSTLATYKERFLKTFQEKKNLDHLSSDLDTRINDLEPYFETFLSYTEFFEHINFLAKKEVTRWQIFANTLSSLSTDTMDQLSDSIKNTLEQAMHYYDRSKENLIDDFEHFRENYLVQKGVIEEIIENSENAHKSLHSTEDILTDTLKNLSQFTGILRKEVQSTIQDVEEIKVMKKDCENIEKMIQPLATEIKDLIQKVSDLSKLDIPPTDQKAILDISSIYSVKTEKEVLAEVFPELEVEESLENTVELF